MIRHLSARLFFTHFCIFSLDLEKRPRRQSGKILLEYSVANTRTPNVASMCFTGIATAKNSVTVTH